MLRLIRLRRRLPGLSWGDALLRRWSDLPLLLPFWRWLRLVPVLERLQTSGLVNFEPLRAVVSRGVVALLAVELFEVLSLQILDGTQGLIRSRRWPQRLRALRSHQSVASSSDERAIQPASEPRAHRGASTATPVATAAPGRDRHQSPTS